ncbi:type II toxin-antitoxin system VapC family toxin [Pseudomonas sp. KNUC1026]|uniref:type II toxin-antitoxin system VapC family toxin n=1 Tax=Pseudomonas sp. KNUC1026 TaxID=2893890 RepID=UPI001F3B4FA6|nr:type II toxin-antitoxin system VapC family toxin [Pseudomonas sp. KNUC1026]UFH48689.1 type II toxin-antitoxin system VapC family toxin [Pseudomonas sp. KNUC1026]
MVKLLYGANILIDYLNGIVPAQLELDKAANPMISVITWMEVMAGTSAAEEGDIRAWLETFQLIRLDSKIADVAVSIRKLRRIKLPDAIVWASAKAHSAVLVSRNVKDFPPQEADVRVPYLL